MKTTKHISKEIKDAAIAADLPRALNDLEWELKFDSHNGWRIPGYGGLIVWQRDNSLWGWKQFSTDEYGDTISFLTTFDNMTFHEAVKTLAPYQQSNVNMAKTLSKKANNTIDHPWRLRKVKCPPEKWQDIASNLVTFFKLKLWKQTNLPVFDWLHQRGLKDQKIKSSKIGWISADYYGTREKWGLPTILVDNEKPKKLWVPEGLLIPILDNHRKVSRLWVRRFKNDEGPKYYCFPGSSMQILTLGTVGRPVIIVESDLDALLIHQEAGDIITAASLGSSGGKPDTQLAVNLLTAPKILISLDADKAGRKAAKWWTETFSKAIYWPVPWGKDPGDAFGSEPSLLKSWIQTGLKKDTF